MSQPPLTPHKVIAARMRQLRTGRGWSAQRLSEEMSKVGVPWDRSIVANLESGRRRTVSVEEMLALAYVLSVAPVHLVVPPVGQDDKTPYAVVPNSGEIPNPPPDTVRGWIRGHAPWTADPRRYFTEVPDSEWNWEESFRAAAEGERARPAPTNDGEHRDGR